jgi:hypothetical protein
MNFAFSCLLALKTLTMLLVYENKVHSPTIIARNDQNPSILFELFRVMIVTLSCAMGARALLLFLKFNNLNIN